MHERRDRQSPHRQRRFRKRPAAAAVSAAADDRFPQPAGAELTIELAT
jgi:hypothetical protein